MTNFKWNMEIILIEINKDQKQQDLMQETAKLNL